MVSEINVAGSNLLTYSLHVESRGNDALRLSQIDEVLSDAARQDPASPVIVAGDFTLDASKDAAHLAFARAGFQDAGASARTPTTPSRGLFEPGRRINWAFIPGPIRAGSGRVHNHVNALDHYPISFSLTASHG